MAEEISEHGQHFVGRWKVVANDMVKPPPTDPSERRLEVAVIEPDRTSRKGIYRLCQEVVENGIVKHECLQKLRYDPVAGMLGNLDRQRRRCIAFWNLGDSRCIFAMRRKTKGASEPLFPWEKAQDDGTWGAELDPPVAATASPPAG